MESPPQGGFFVLGVQLRNPSPPGLHSRFALL